LASVDNNGWTIPLIGIDESPPSVCSQSRNRRRGIRGRGAAYKKRQINVFKNIASLSANCAGVSQMHASQSAATAHRDFKDATPTIA
jgi:hypothetical protein